MLSKISFSTNLTLPNHNGCFNEEFQTNIRPTCTEVQQHQDQISILLMQTKTKSFIRSIVCPKMLQDKLLLYKLNSAERQKKLKERATSEALCVFELFGAREGRCREEGEVEQGWSPARGKRSRFIRRAPVCKSVRVCSAPVWLGSLSPLPLVLAGRSPASSRRKERRSRTCEARKNKKNSEQRVRV